MTPFVALALRTGLVRRACTLLYPLGFVLASLPVWLYESQHFPSGLWSSGEGLFAVSQPFLLRAADLLRTDWPIILGADVRAWPLPGQGAIIGVLVTLGTVAVVWAGIRDHRAVAWTTGATRGRPPNGSSSCG